MKFALERIEAGTYGRCLRCDKDISKCPHAVPGASHCAKCQDIADREPAGEELIPAVHTRDVD